LKETVEKVEENEKCRRKRIKVEKEPSKKRVEKKE
jgi:hypothetical protein